MTGPPTIAISPADDRVGLLDAAMRRHRYQSGALIEILHTAQQLYGYLDPQCLRYISHALRLPPSRVYGVATFYNFFSLTPRGRHTCVVCTGTACYVNGSASVLRAIEERHNLQVGETTADSAMSLITARCLGACGLAPVLVLDSEITGHMTADAALGRLEAWTRDDH